MKALLKASFIILPRDVRARAITALLALLVAPAFTGVRAQPIVEGGSPLYVLAVRESVQGLRGRNAPAQAAAAAQTPPLATPAAAAVQTPAGVPAPAAGTNSVAAFEPTPEFLSRYYFCTNCQAWHLRSAAPGSILQQSASNGLAPATTLFTNRTLFQPTNPPPMAPAPAPGQ